MSSWYCRFFLLVLLSAGHLNASELDGRADEVESIIYSLAPQLWGATATQLRELAPLVSEQSQVWQDPFEPERWQATTDLELAGLSIRFVESNNGDGATVIAFTLRDLGRSSPQIQKSMSNISSVEKLLGPPLTVADNRWTYQGQHSSLQISFNNGQVTEISVWLHWC